MANTCITAVLLLLSITAVARTQYIDLLQGLQQFLQPYQPNKLTQNNGDITRHTGRQHNKQNPDERRSNEHRKKKPTLNQFDYIFATTTKPSRKTTKSSSQTKVVSNNNSNKNRNLNSDFARSSYEITTKSNREKPTTTNVNNRRIYTTTTTTENVLNYNLNNRAGDGVNNKPVSQYDNQKSEKVASTTYNNSNNRYTGGQSNNRDTVNNNSNNRGTLDHSNNRDTVDNNFNNRGTVDNSNNRDTVDNNFNNRGTVDNFNNRDTVDNNFNNRGNVDNFNNRGILYNNSNNRGTVDHFNNRGTVDNSNNRGTVDRPTSNNKKNNVYSSTTSNIVKQNKPNNNVVNNNVANNKPGNNRNVNVADIDKRITDEINTTTGSKDTRTNFVRQVHNFGFATDNPFVNRPNIWPGVDYSAPITNSPVIDSIYFPNSGGNEPQQQEPELELGPDEDDMTSLQKRRYIDLGERMCTRYKALNVKKLVALPPSLIPSPTPVEFNVTSCNPYSIPLVIGGKPVDITDFPHMALIGWRKERVAGYSWKCGGSLISERYVLTAGHCTYQDKDSNVVTGLPHVIQLGSSYLDDPGAQVVRISSVIRHPKYKRSRAYHDIALIKMMRKVTFSQVIKPACVGVSPEVGKKIIATGWGRTEIGGDNSLELRGVSLPIWDLGECSAIWGTSFRLPAGPTPDSHVCAGDRTGLKDTCQGDSGGPAQVQDGCIWRVVAVTSIGKACATPDTPALYAVIPRAFIAAQVFGDEVDYGGRGRSTSNRRGEDYYRN